MKILVIGSGKVGRTIIEYACQEGHDVTIIDKSPKVIEQLVNQYDVMGMCGNGASYDILKAVSVEKMDIVISITSSDETNILTCLVTKKMSKAITIARVRNYEYNNQLTFLTEYLGIDMIINPELEAANDISRIVKFPQVNKVDSFSNGKVDLVEVYVPDNSPLIGLSLSSIHQKYQVKVLVCAVQRGDDVFIPTGSFTFQAKDKIHITASSGNVRLFLYKLGLIESKLKNVLIVGGSKVAVYLINDLVKNKFDVKVIEKDYDRCLELSELVPGATIIHGDGANQELLQEEGMNTSDAIISLTGIDEENIIISMYAYKQEVHKIIAKVNNVSFAQLLDSIGVASVISPKEITATRIISYLRSKVNARGSNVVTLYKLVNNRVEALEFRTKENSRVLNTCLKDLRLKDKILIVSIIRDGNVIIPSGNDQILLNDSVIVVTTNQFLNELNDILE